MSHSRARDEVLLNYDLEKGEYLCPICERLCNAALPVFPALSALKADVVACEDGDFGRFIDKMRARAEGKVEATAFLKSY